MTMNPPRSYKPLGPHWPQLVAMLDRHGVNLVFDVGANVGQYGQALRASGFAGRIVSVEPVGTAHAELARTAAADPLWQVTPPAAVGAASGTIAVNVSASSDMSSVLPFTPEAARDLDSDRMIARETVPMITVADLIARYAGSTDRILLKSDTQGYELEVLRGAGGHIDRLSGLQLELSLYPIYVGQPTWRETVDMLLPRGFDIHLIIPGYFSRRLGRLVEMDVVLFGSAA